MADSKKAIQFKAEATGTVFEAVLESYAHPEASWYQWVTGLPEALRKPGTSFHTTKGPGMFSLTVGENTKTGELVARDDGAVLCQITGMSVETTCTGNGNGRGGCGATLLVEQPDLFTTYSFALGERERHVTFRCSACGVLTDLPDTIVP